MKACAVLFLLLPVFPFSRLASPARYLSIFSSLINFVSLLYGAFPGRDFLFRITDKVGWQKLLI